MCYVRVALGRSKSSTVKKPDSYSHARQWPDKILTTPCDEVTLGSKHAERRATEIGRRLAYLVRMDPQSVGMSAPQIGVPKRVLAYKRPDGAVAVLVNPRIVKRSRRSVKDVEGCFSCRGFWIMVRRSKRITVEFQDLDGTIRTFEAEDYPARILQHEIDHLDGVTVRDRGEGEEMTYEQAMEHVQKREARAKRRKLRLA